MQLLGNLKSVKCSLTNIFRSKIFGSGVSLLKFATIQLRRGGSSQNPWFPGMFVFRNVSANGSANLTGLTVVIDENGRSNCVTYTDAFNWTSK